MITNSYWEIMHASEGNERVIVCNESVIGVGKSEEWQSSITLQMLYPYKSLARQLPCLCPTPSHGPAQAAITYFSTVHFLFTLLHFLPMMRSIRFWLTRIKTSVQTKSKTTDVLYYYLRFRSDSAVQFVGVNTQQVFVLVICQLPCLKIIYHRWTTEKWWCLKLWPRHEGERPAPHIDRNCWRIRFRDRLPTRLHL